MLDGPSYSFHACLSRFLSHGSKRRVLGEFRDGFRRVLVERVAALLMNLPSLCFCLVAVTIIESRFLYGISFREKLAFFWRLVNTLQ
jgi:hypothetical protein